jgi:His-Xaa-Ser system protein HxsD
MSEDHQVTADQTPEGVVLSFDESIYPKDAVFGAAYTLLDRCFVHIDREGTKLQVKLRAKPGVALSTEGLAGEFEAEALAQTWRRDIVRESQALIESVTTRALAGAAGPPGLDDLLDEDLGDLGDAFDDPLGIAVSWEDKYGKGEAADAATNPEPAMSEEPDEGKEGP